MESSQIYIDPLYVSTDRAKFTISVISIKLFTSAVIAVTFFDSTDKRVDRILLNLTDTDYLQWYKDHDYLVTYVNNYIVNTYSSPGGGVD